MKQKWYRGPILNRILTKDEQEFLDERYEMAKVRNLGSGIAYALEQEMEKKKIRLIRGGMLESSSKFLNNKKEKENKNDRR